MKGTSFMRKTKTWKSFLNTEWGSGVIVKVFAFFIIRMRAAGGMYLFAIVDILQQYNTVVFSEKRVLSELVTSDM